MRISDWSSDVCSSDIGMSTADPYATLDYVEKYTEEVNNIASKDKAIDNIFMLNGIGGGGMSTASNTAITGFVLKPWNKRDKSTAKVQQSLQQHLSSVAGRQYPTFMHPPIYTT